MRAYIVKQTSTARSSLVARPRLPATGSMVHDAPECLDAARGGDLTRVPLTGSIQRKPLVSSPGDVLEREADDVADKVMRMADPVPIAAASPTIQRKCAACEEDEEKKIQTKRVHPSITLPESATDTAVRAATLGGTPLASDLRSFFEPRFRRDFSSVRIHSNDKAAAAASVVQARAYTYGEDIAFGAGQFAPSTSAGKLLLAHELAHVEQQRGAGGSGGSMRLANGVPSQAMIARDSDIELEVDPDCPPDLMCFTIMNGNMAHRELSERDKKAIIANAGGVASAAPSPIFSKDGPRFVLHDTAISYGPPAKEAQHLKELKRAGNTPVGEGAAAYVTAAGAPEQTHSRFFDAQRPTATEFERGNDLMDLFSRETAIQLVWSLTDPVWRSAGIADFLRLFPGMSAKDISDETTKATKNLDPSITKPVRKAGAKAQVMTTASGAVGRICDAVTGSGATGIAITGQEAALTTACTSLKLVFDARKVRIPDTTNVEIVADKGTDCDTSKNAAPFAGYAAAAYDAVARLYVHAALEAGQFPEITTHFYLDSITPAGSANAVTKSQNRCDPRCFDLDLLYAKIAALLGHRAGTTYGIAPNYGTQFGVSNIWWPPDICGSRKGTSVQPVPRRRRESRPRSKS